MMVLQLEESGPSLDAKSHNVERCEPYTNGRHICVHKRKGCGGHFVCPISNLTVHLAALFFVYDTDLIHINLKEEETATVAHQSMQDIISN